MNSGFLFALAAVVAAVSILTTFKIQMDKLKQTPEDRMNIQTKFFIGVAISEAIPIILVVLGFVYAEPVASMDELLLPGIIILLTMALAPFFIFLQTKVDVTEEIKPVVTTFSMIGMALALGIPIISLVGLFTLLSS